MSLRKVDTKWRYFHIIVCKMSILGLEYPFKLVKPAFVDSTTHLKGLCPSFLVHSVNNANCASLFSTELEWQGHKFVSQPLFQKLQTTAMNFEKLLD